MSVFTSYSVFLPSTTRYPSTTSTTAAVSTLYSVFLPLTTRYPSSTVTASSFGSSFSLDSTLCSVFTPLMARYPSSTVTSITLSSCVILSQEAKTRISERINNVNVISFLILYLLLMLYFDYTNFNARARDCKYVFLFFSKTTK